MAWQDSFDTHVWIFSIGRGNAAFVRSGLNHGFIIDMACSEDFDPAAFVKDTFSKKLTKYKDFRIAQALLSHPHRDHIQQCEQLADGKPLHPQLLTCPNDTQAGEEVDWDRVSDDREGSAELLQSYRDLFKKRTPPLQTIEYETNRQLASPLEYGIYYLRPPVCDRLHPEDDNQYGNATSIMLYLRYGVNTILFPGDMTPEGMERALDDSKGVEKRYTLFKPSFTRDHPDWHEKTSDQPSLGTLLDENGLSILVAPHHALESCFSQKLYDTMKDGKPQLVVISEKRHTRPEDGKIHATYQGKDGASGLNVWIDGTKERRYSVSTANGHHILVVFNGTGVPKVYAEKNPAELLSYLD
jgi:hypothetical protein